MTTVAVAWELIKDIALVVGANPAILLVGFLLLRWLERTGADVVIRLERIEGSINDARDTLGLLVELLTRQHSSASP